MTTATDYYPDLDSLDRDGLLAEREKIFTRVREEFGGDYKLLDDDGLARLIAVNVKLRMKNAGPPKVAKGAKVEASAEDLA